MDGLRFWSAPVHVDFTQTSRSAWYRSGRPGCNRGMASVDVSVASDVSPRRAWALASDLRRFDEWMTIFAGWQSDVRKSLTNLAALA